MIATSLLSLGLGGLGAGLAYWLGFPAPFLTGPALLVSLAAMAGLRSSIPVGLRNACFLIVGLNLGTGVTPAVLHDALRWPASLLAMAISIVLFMLLGTWALRRMTGCATRTALLAATPGHLSFVLGLSLETGADLTFVSAVQSLRVLMLTLLVPAAVALFSDADLTMAVASGAPIALVHLGLLTALAAGLGMIFTRLRVPAAFLLAGMAVSVLGHGSGLTPGAAPRFLTYGAFITMGTLIGTRFSGITLRQIGNAALSAVVLTGGGMIIVLLASLAVHEAVGLPVADVLIALAPGGLETMIAMSSVIGADPTFVGFHHVARIFLLSFLIPIALARTPPVSKV
ncbi:MAG: AbrB family transcriptional regulator [Rhodobacteraceae bacterium]|nr:AbrB family transcriptional regulator [Paracoccaceae bacterium]